MRSHSVVLVCSIISLASSLKVAADPVSGSLLFAPSDVISWSQLGEAGDLIASGVTVSSAGGNSATANFSDPSGGTLARICPSPNCNYFAGPPFASGDYLLWAENSEGNGTGPLHLVLGQRVRGVELQLELTSPGSFIAALLATTPVATEIDIESSDGIGDPVSLGVLDSAADVTGFTVLITSCNPSSPGGCSATDFAVGPVGLLTAAPEPGNCATALIALAFYSLWHWRKPFKRYQAVLMLASVLAVSQGYAQESALEDAQDAAFADGTAALRDSEQIANSGAQFAPLAAATSATLPTWRYQLVSPANGVGYSGYMVGTNPFNRGARTTVLPTVLIPVVAHFINTTSGFNTVFDPSLAPDAGCTAGQTVLNLVENSPIFQNQNWLINGVNVGFTQYADAFQRANFWQYVQNTGDAYHTLLSYTEGEPMSVDVTYSAPTTAGEVRVGISSACTNPSGAGSTNAAGYEGIVDMPIINNAAQAYITSHQLTPDVLPIFILYNVVMTQSSNPGFYVGGYHHSNASYPAALTSPGQTFAVSTFQTVNFYTRPNPDVAILSHEVGEWLSDPGDFNLAPAWGHIGQESGCSQYLEVGDPLTGTTFAVAGSNGFTYHVQELAFFSWFFRIPATGAGDGFSDNTAFTQAAGPVCTP